MHRLNRAVRDLRIDDAGFSMVFVAVVLVALIGMVAFAVDVGAMYAERRELQNGAEAAALAIAEDCARGLPCDSAAAAATADEYADANARDLRAGVDSVDLDTAAGTVRVVTSTEEISGSTILSPYFARVVGFGGATVRAEASAAWGHPTSATAIPIIISDCEYDRESWKIHEPPWDPALEVTFYFHDGQSAEDCNAQAGQDADGNGRLPGGFGWLDSENDCWAVIEDGWAGEDPGASPTSGCSADDLRSLLYQDKVFVPYFDDVTGLGANGQYRVAGFGALHVTGYNFGGQYKEPSAAQAPCRGDDRCISGYLTTGTMTWGDLGGDDRGVIVVKLTG